MKGRHFMLFSNCIPVKGYARSIICDIQRNEFHLIPNGLFDILNTYEGETLEAIKSEHHPKDHEVIEDYFSFLEDKELIFWLDDASEQKRFPKLSMDYKSHSIISNAIIDIDHNSTVDFVRIADQLETLGCVALQLRFYDAISLDKLSVILDSFKTSRIRHVDLVLKHISSVSVSQVKALKREYSRVAHIIVYGAKQEKQDGIVIYTKQDFNSCLSCGEISKFNFLVNKDLFIESQHYNSCLNKKIAIDKKGYIKNCPSMSQSFGHISNTSLLNAVKIKDFKAYWNIQKDKIKGCSDCEFRYICTDCRAFKEDPQDDFSKPLKCGYNPYTNVWEEWSTNPLKQKVMRYYKSLHANVSA